MSESSGLAFAWAVVMRHAHDLGIRDNPTLDLLLQAIAKEWAEAERQELQ
jgi:hypothetical protein